MGAMNRHVPAPPYVLLALATLFWSGNFVLGRAVSARIPPVGLAFWRWVGAFAVLLPLSYPRLKEQWPLLRGSWKTLVPLGILGVGSFNTLVYVGLHETTATNAVLLNSACPAFIAAITFLVRGQRATLRQGTGILLSLLGVAAIVSRGAPESLLTLSFNPGDLWVLTAVLCWAVYTVLLGRRPGGIHPMAFLTALVGVGVAWLAPLYAVEIVRGGRMALDAVTFGSLVYLALLPSLASYVFWNQAVGEVGPTRAGAFLHLMPAFGSLLAVLLLGESFRLYHILGIGLILSGVTLAGGAAQPARPARGKGASGQGGPTPSSRRRSFP
jgi:drug/metabolite transporter (DMT)-like permease